MSIVVVCRVRLVRELLADLFGRLSQAVRQACESVEQIETLADRDIVILYEVGALEESLPKVAALRTRCQGAAIAVIGRRGSGREAEALRAAGADLVVSEDEAASTAVGMIVLLRAGFQLIGEEAEGGPALNGEAEGRRIRHRPSLDHPGHSLSPQELKIMRRLVGGLSNKAIANEFGISEATVKVHLRSCYEKIGARNRTQAAMWATTHLNQRPA